MFKPGTRVLKIANNPVGPAPWQGSISLPLIGATGVVVPRELHWENVARGADFVVALDGETITRACFSRCWVEFKDPTSQSAASFLQSLSKPKVMA